MLKVQNLTKTYRNQKAVDAVSFTVNAGEVVGLLGPNGAGKSTTIKAIAGLLRADAGEISISGYPHKSSDARLRFAYIPEMPELYDMLTVREHLRFVALAYSKTNWELRMDAMAARFDMIEHMDKLVKELSKGMKQKVAFLCALLPEPELLLFDEPMVGLDPKAIRETKLLFREMAAAGKAVFVSTHLLDTIETLCDRIMVMKKGCLIADGTPADLRRQFGEDSDASLEELFLEVTADA